MSPLILAKSHPVPFFSLPNPTPMACRLADNFGIKPVFETARM
jgi:hypothetical protein